VIFAALPIFWTPQVKIAPSAHGALAAAIPSVLLFAADGWIAAGYHFVWQIALFLALGESFSAYGGAMALAAIVGAVSGMVLGRLVDAGHGVRAVSIVFTALAATALLRAASYDNAPLAVIANACGAFVGCLYVPALLTAVYNDAKRSPCPLRFQVAAEGGWDLGGIGALLAAAGLLAAGVPMAVCILLSLFGAGASFLLLRHYYAFRASGATARHADAMRPMAEIFPGTPGAE
jgi:MFS transporter, DHA1 family, inner membrane transport protein